MSVKSASKKGTITFCHWHGGRPSNFGALRPGTSNGQLSRKALANLRKLAAMRKNATKQAVEKEILAFRRNGWGKLTKAEKATRTSIMQALFRRGVATGIASRQTVIEALETLAQAGKIKLPPKTNHGGPNRVKAKK